ncbi:MAG: S-formylglutathione hydrolase [Rhodospirillales bacterium 24-66-33]|jgi:S-formylglutathione hydrolase|nr:MAG: S-formylglutathione hydrolase [Rhodospirillales bacterium 35-66-84]OYZ92400.1 MAG: S-formylglutathione hydrolase [Rhodospirillales bacterium 24-66-33]OZB22134.1 MAG: S-formylglutathione hydrolase [Rhodospirillales bacterium 39-66-50]
MAGMTTRSEQACFGGTIGFYSHASTEIGVEMRFSVFVPSNASARPLPALYFLAGLTCTEETFMMKANALRYAAELGLVLVAPDTSPRGLGLPGEEDDWDFGTGAGFYLDAEAEPWRQNYRMYSYVTRELPALVEATFPVDAARRGVFGHSMGGHGALVVALKNPQAYRSVSAFAPICNPVAVPWGEKAFGNYLGPDRARWAAWDASELLKQGNRFAGPILVDQGLKDQFLAPQLRPDALEAAAASAGQELILRRHEAYDHSYWFIQTFIEDHLRWHAERLGA